MSVRACVRVCMSVYVRVTCVGLTRACVYECVCAYVRVTCIYTCIETYLPYFVFLFISHVIQLKHHKRREPRAKNIAGAQALAVARRPEEASRERFIDLTADQIRGSHWNPVRV